jgi:hypothetical protein
VKLSRESVQIENIRRNGGTQVREGLDSQWVDELAELYADGHELPDPVVMRDSDDVDWLVDGFHRIAALEKNGSQGVRVEVLHGSLDMAKAQAARANTNGLPRTPGDKKRAILLMRRTEEGKSMGQRELARHCGVACSYVHGVLAGEGVFGSERERNVLGKTRRERVEHDAATAREALAATPSASSEEIARRIGVSSEIVRRERSALGIPNERDISAQRIAEARDLWTKDPSLTANEVHRLTKADRRKLVALRDELGIVPASKGASAESKRRNGSSGSRRSTTTPQTVAFDEDGVVIDPPSAEPPSAPPRKRNDPRAGSEEKTVRKRPVELQQRVKSAEKLVESMDDDERAMLAARLETRWPQHFAAAFLRAAE